MPVGSHLGNAAAQVDFQWQFRCLVARQGRIELGQPKLIPAPGRVAVAKLDVVVTGVQPDIRAGNRSRLRTTWSTDAAVSTQMHGEWLHTFRANKLQPDRL